MSFLNPEADKQNDTSKVHVRELEWSGGVKQDPKDPTVSRAYAEIRTREGSGDSAVKGKLDEPKMRFAPLGMATFAMGGVVAHDNAGGVKTYTSYFSNETTAYGQPLRVFKRTPDGSITVAAEGEYNEIYEKVGQFAKGQYYLYFYDFDRKCIDRFCFKGSSKNEWKAFQKTMGQGQLYKGAIVIEPGEFKQFPVGGGAILPKFSQPAPYTEAELAEIKPFAEQYMAYEEGCVKRALQIAREMEEGGTGASINQTPAQYEGEGSQEYPDAPATTYDMTDAPF